MLENELVKVFIPIIKYGVNIITGINDIAVRETRQPTQQGLESNETIYFYLIYNNPFGFLQRFDRWNATNLNFDHIEVQNYEAAFQFNAKVIQSAANGLTSFDLLDATLHSMQSDYAVQKFKENNMQVLRVTEMRNEYFLDDRNRQQSFPSFDIIFKHLNVYKTVTPMVQSINSGIYPI